MKELVICSGKGGTGKTSVTAAMATLATDHVVADCDVDAADMHLVLAPRHTREEPFQGGHLAFIQPDLCAACGDCFELCRFGAIEKREEAAGNFSYHVNPLHCEGCGVCVHFCPTEAIAFPRATNGAWYVSETRCAPMVHARLIPGEENSGKLVTLVRQEARKLAEARQAALILVDGPPGIGCPVTAAITGADQVLAVTEPGVSGRHDLHRLLQLTRHFEVPLAVVINKCDINPEMADAIAADCSAAGVPVLGRVPFDPAITRAQLEERTVVEMEGDIPAARALREIWSRVETLLANNPQGDNP